jgi:hypothetical protein
VLLDADANDGPRLLEAFRTLELPLVLVFNRGRVMAAPQGVSKGTGLRVALETLRLSARNTVAVDKEDWLVPFAELFGGVGAGVGAIIGASKPDRPVILLAPPSSAVPSSPSPRP